MVVVQVTVNMREFSFICVVISLFLVFLKSEYCLCNNNFVALTTPYAETNFPPVYEICILLLSLLLLLLLLLLLFGNIKNLKVRLIIAASKERLKQHFWLYLMQLKTKLVELKWKISETSMCISEMFSLVHVISWYATRVST